jgi:N-acetylglucosaminyldiphosphoundecaprenol N-acetyl-beta-D-mannosaminyltransferase
MLRGLGNGLQPGERAEPGEASPPEAIELLGVRIDCLRRADLIDRAAHAAAGRDLTTILYINVHCLNIAGRDPAYAEILRDADIVYCDGTGVRLGASLAGKALPERMTGADWIHDLCRRAVRDGLRLFLIAGEPGIAPRAAALLRVHYPGLQIVGTLPGYGVDEEAVIEINCARADILLVGMGTPTQEKWIAANRDALAPPVIWAVGALFDFVSGKLPRGPRWMTDNGLEWLCRLAAEPRKLWRRYLVGNPLFLWHVIRTYWTHG